MIKGTLKIILNTLILILLASCAQTPTKGTQGGLTGGLLGAASGALIGQQTGDAAEGAIIGTAIGAIAGSAYGNKLDRSDIEHQRARDRLANNRRVIEENRMLIEELKSRGADAYDTQRGVVVNLPDVLFQFDSANLTSEAQRTINDIADVLSKTGSRALAVEGHTDAVGSFSYNKDLSLRRARSVSNALARNGISRGRMDVRGYGEGRPVTSNNTDAGRARNRRVEVIIEN